MSGEKKAAWWMLKNSAGEKDGMWTLVVAAFAVTTFSFLLSMLGQINIGKMKVDFKEFDTTYATVVLMPTLLAYFGRRRDKDSKKVESEDLKSEPAPKEKVLTVDPNKLEILTEDLEEMQ